MRIRINSLINLSVKQEEKHVRPLTFILSPHYKMITDELVKAASRRGLLTAAFVALREILLSSPTDCYWVVLGTTDRLLESLRKVDFLTLFRVKRFTHLAVYLYDF